MFISYIKESCEKSAASSTLANAPTSDAQNAVAISVDSLDLSCLEPGCNDVISRCRNQDKHRYRIAFEKSWHDAINASGCQASAKQISKFGARNGFAENHVEDEIQRLLSRSVQVANKTNLSRLARLMNRSMNSDFASGSRNLAQMSATITGGNQFVPVYNSAASCATTTSSGGDSTSGGGPTSLIKMFIANRVSPSSSGGLLSSFEDSPLTSSLCTQNYLQGANQTTIESMSEEKSNAALELAKNRQMQSSPITEEEDDFSESNGGKTRETSLHPSVGQIDGPAQKLKQTRQKRNIDFGLQQQHKVNTCRRSFSMEEFSGRTQQTLTARFGNLTQPQLSDMTTSPPNNPSIPNSSSTRKLHSRECSVSSGYLSGGPTNAGAIAFSMSDWSRKAQTGRGQAFRQTARDSGSHMPIVQEDKQVQTSIEGTFVLSQPQTPAGSGERANPVYVYYPNYSLPDLQFVQQLAPLSIELLPNSSNSRVPISAPTRLSRRPRSCGEFDKLNKDQFKHSQDWESLTTLLPKELQTLVKTLKLDVPSEASHQKHSKNVGNSRTSTATTTMAATPAFSRIHPMQKVRKVNSLDSNLCGVSRCDCSRAATTSHVVMNRRCSTLDCNSCGHFVPSCFSHPHSPGTTLCSQRTSVCCRDSQITLAQSSACRNSVQSGCTLGNSSGCSHVSGQCTNLTRPRGLIKSSSMNMAVHCHCSPIPVCTSRCTTTMASCTNVYPSNFCHFKGNCASGSHSSSHAVPACSTPATPCDPISEQVEEFDSFNQWLDHQKLKDFDAFIHELENQKLPPNERTRQQIRFPSKAPSRSDKQTSPEEPAPAKNFSALRNRWELMAKQPLPNSKPRIQVKAKVDTGVKSGPIRRRARSRSPPKSNKEVVIVTKPNTATSRTNKASGSTNVHNLINTRVTRNVGSTRTLVASNRNASATKTPIQTPPPLPPLATPAKRPSSFNAQFKSMIPVPRSSIKSPPVTKSPY